MGTEERKGWKGECNYDSKIKHCPQAPLLCTSDVYLYFSKLILCTGTSMWLYVAWKLPPSFPLLLQSTLLKWLSVKKKTLSEKPTGRHIRIWTKENTSLLSSTTHKRTLDTHIHIGLHTLTLCGHTPLWTCPLSGQTLGILSDFKPTKWMDLKPLLVVNTRSHVNNVCKSSSTVSNDV